MAGAALNDFYLGVGYEAQHLRGFLSDILRACVTGAYQRRISELKIRAAQLPVFATAQYVCAGAAPTTLTARYYRSDPPAVLIEYQGTEVVAFVAASGSGARYTADDVELWEHQGTATVHWHGQELTCPRS